MFALLLALVAAPVIQYQGVYNAASRIPPALPGGSLAKGILFTITGRSLGPAVAVTARGRLPLQLGGVRVRLSGGGWSADVPLVYVSDARIDALLPASARIGNALLTVTYDGIESEPIVVSIADRSLGIFESTLIPGTTSDLIAEADPEFRRPQSTFAPGAWATLWTTGAVRPNGLRVSVGGKPATRRKADPVASLPGVQRLRFQIPLDAPTGCDVPILLVANDAVSNTTTIPIARTGSDCSDSDHPIASDLRSSGQAAVVAVAQASYRLTRRDNPEVYDFSWDTALFAPAKSGRPSPGKLPPPDTCSTFRRAPPAGSSGSSSNLESGREIRLTTTDAVRSIPLGAGDVGAEVIGGAPPYLRMEPQAPFLKPGPLTASYTGIRGTAFSAATRINPSTLALAEFEAPVANRRTGLSLSWTGGADATLIVVFGIEKASRASVACVCLAPLGAHSFRVPPELLLAIPPSARDPFVVLPLSGVALIELPDPPGSGAVTGQSGLVVVPLTIVGRSLLFH